MVSQRSVSLTIANCQPTTGTVPVVEESSLLMEDIYGFQVGPHSREHHRQAAFVHRAQLSNTEVSSDEELQKAFVDAGMTEAQARRPSRIALDIVSISTLRAER